VIGIFHFAPWLGFALMAIRLLVRDSATTQFNGLLEFYTYDDDTREYGATPQNSRTTRVLASAASSTSIGGPERQRSLQRCVTNGSLDRLKKSDQVADPLSNPAFIRP
jgi:hypothetical protein